MSVAVTVGRRRSSPTGSTTISTRAQSTKASRRNTARIASAMSLTALLAISAGCVAQTQPPVAPAPPVALYDGVGIARLLEEHDVAVLRTRFPVAIPDLELLETLRGL